MSSRGTLRAQLVLVLVSLIWGLTFPLIRQAMVEVAPFQFVLFRFSFAALLFLPLFLVKIGRERDVARGAWQGLLIGVLLWVSYLSQTIGLQHVSAGRAAFLTGTNVVMVPLLSPLLGQASPSKVDFGSAALALGGIYLMTGFDAKGVSAGDAWILMCAFSYALYVLFLQQVSARTKLSSRGLAFFQVLGVASSCVLTLPFQTTPFKPVGEKTLVALLFCAIFATVGTFWLQTRFQRDTTPSRAALIFSTEPVFAAIFGFWLLHEVLSPLTCVGGGLILLSILGSEALKTRMRNKA